MGDFPVSPLACECNTETMPQSGNTCNHDERCSMAQVKSIKLRLEARADKGQSRNAEKRVFCVLFMYLDKGAGMIVGVEEFERRER